MLVPYFFERFQVDLAHMALRIPDLGQIISCQGIEAETAIISCTHGTVSFCHIKEDCNASFGMSRYQVKLHGDIAKGHLIAIADHTIRFTRSIHKIRAVLDKGFFRMFAVHDRIRFAHINLCAEHIAHKFYAANMIDMAVGKQDPLHISRIKTSFPDGMDQHGGIAAVSGIDQKKSVPGIDQMYTNPAVSYIINISEHTKRLHITLCLLRPVFGHRVLFKFCSFCKIVFIIFYNAHDNPSCAASSLFHQFAHLTYTFRDKICPYRIIQIWLTFMGILSCSVYDLNLVRMTRQCNIYMNLL